MFSQATHTGGCQRETAGAGRNTMETAQLGFSAWDREKSPGLPRVWRLRGYSLLKEPFTEPNPGPDKISTEEACQELEAEQERARMNLASCWWRSSMLLSWEIKGGRGPSWTIKPLISCRIFQGTMYQLERRKKGSATEHAHDVTTK